MITSKEERTTVAGAHEHTFANPHGYVFRVGCYSAAPGCIGFGQVSTEFPWFAGYAWQVALCSKCTEHIGWRFTSRDHIFLGLIVSKLVERTLRGG